MRYVLEGSVRKAGDRVRIHAQLIDAPTGRHLWAERYDRDLKDIFALQDEITMKILTALRVKLTEGEQARVYGKDTDNLDCFLKILEGQSYLFRHNKNDNLLARRLFEEAMSLDPDSLAAHISVAGTHLIDVGNGWSENPEKSMELAIEITQKALVRDDTLDYAHSLMGSIYLFQRQHEKAIAELERAVSLSPNGADAHAFLATALILTGRPEEAIELIMKAMRFNPMPQNWYYASLAHAYRNTGRHEDAINTLQKVLTRNPEDFYARIGLTASYIMAGQEEEGRKQAVEVLRLNPEFSIEYFAKTMPYSNQADTERDIEVLRKAGLK